MISLPCPSGDAAYELYTIVYRHVASFHDDIATTMQDGTGDLAFNPAAYELFTDLGDTMYRCSLFAEAIMKCDEGIDAEVEATEEAMKACTDAAASVAATEGESPPNIETFGWDVLLKYTADQAKQLTQSPIATVYLHREVCDLTRTLMNRLESCEKARYWTPEDITALLRSTRALSIEAQDENVRRLANTLHQYLSEAAENAMLMTLQSQVDEVAEDSFARWGQLLRTRPEDMPIAPEHFDLASKMGILFDQEILWQLEAEEVIALVELVEQMRDSDGETDVDASDA